MIDEREDVEVRTQAGHVLAVLLLGMMFLGIVGLVAFNAYTSAQAQNVPQGEYHYQESPQQNAANTGKSIIVAAPGMAWGEQVSTWAINLGYPVEVVTTCDMLDTALFLKPQGYAVVVIHENVVGGGRMCIDVVDKRMENIPIVCVFSNGYTMSETVFVVECKNRFYPYVAHFDSTLFSEDLQTTYLNQAILNALMFGGG